MTLIAEMRPEPTVEEQIRRIVAAWRARGLDVQRLARELAAGICEDAKHGAPLHEVAIMLRVLADETKPWVTP